MRRYLNTLLMLFSQMNINLCFYINFNLLFLNNNKLNNHIHLNLLSSLKNNY